MYLLGRAMDVERDQGQSGAAGVWMVFLKIYFYYYYFLPLTRERTVPDNRSPTLSDNIILSDCHSADLCRPKNGLEISLN